MSDLSEVILNEDMTRVAGMQPKIMMNLSFDGELQPASNKAATHILKFPGRESDGNSLKGVVEWASMTLARGSGMPCAEFALVRLQGDKKDVLGYVTERFDIPQNEDDMRMIFVEDVCAVLGYPPEAKGMPGLNEVIDKIKAISTHKEYDMEELFKQIAVNYLLENADFHTKNASVIKVANPMLDGFRSVRMAPAYDILRGSPCNWAFKEKTNTSTESGDWPTLMKLANTAAFLQSAQKRFCANAPKAFLAQRSQRLKHFRQFSKSLVLRSNCATRPRFSRPRLCIATNSSPICRPASRTPGAPSRRPHLHMPRQNLD
jgi:hypothetical protein